MPDLSRSERIKMLAKGYAFVARTRLAGGLIHRLLNLLAYLDFDMLIWLSTWHPNKEMRQKLLRKRGVELGENCWVDMGVRIDIGAPKSVIIEDHVVIAYGAEIISHDAGLNSIVDLPMRVKTTTLKRNCAVGSHSIIMPGVTVGRNAGVTAGSVVTKDVPDNVVVAGNPAAVIATIPQLIEKWQADMRRHPEHYFDMPYHWHDPESPFSELLTWRDEGLPIGDFSDIPTGSPIDHINAVRGAGKKNR
ncbi:MAG: acyltransferase [Candidatus Geothermincolia bacterium]